MSKVSYLGVRNEREGPRKGFRVPLARLLFTIGDVCRQAVITTAGVIDKRHLTKTGRKQSKRCVQRLKKVLSDYRETNDKRSLSFANSFDNFPAKIT